MPQGKMKVKAKLPSSIKNKTISKKKDAQKKNRPAKAKKELNLVRREITKTINETNMTTAKEAAGVDGKTFRVLPNDHIAKGAKGGKKESKGK